MPQVTEIALQQDGKSVLVYVDEGRYGIGLPVESILTDDAVTNFLEMVKRNEDIVADAKKRLMPPLPVIEGNVIPGLFGHRRKLGIAALNAALSDTPEDTNDAV